MTAGISGRRIMVGKVDWIKAQGLNTAFIDENIRRLQEGAKTVVLVAVEERVAGIIAVADSIKPEARNVVRQLHEYGITVGMLTGDHRSTARAIADAAGIDEVLAEIRPDEKAARVRAIQENGQVVAMVGDGVNDAPALAQADVGFAIGSGTDVAIEAGEVVLSSGSLNGVIKSLQVSRATMRTVRQNLFWAFCYNVLLIPIAAGILNPFEAVPLMLRQLHPMLAALAMSLSSVSVVFNSLWLYRAKIK